jgi:hypothetical protein
MPDEHLSSSNFTRAKPWEKKNESDCTGFDKTQNGTVNLHNILNRNDDFKNPQKQFSNLNLNFLF